MPFEVVVLDPRVAQAAVEAFADGPEDRSPIREARHICYLYVILGGAAREHPVNRDGCPMSAPASAPGKNGRRLP